QQAPGLLFTLSRAEFQVYFLKDSDGVVTGRLMDSPLLSFPPCSLCVTLEYNRTDTSKSKILANIFTVPPCRFKGDVITAIQNYNQIDEDLSARSGAMIVITVILSVAMFVLLVALIVTFVFSLGIK
ncbi:uncharacterized protein upk2, partial [Osmerus mordax]|uniref:uncharacterized protein upk2 n=1 Tax=Osmerus mordax TaxID=8014 RepID=UPI0035100301